MQSVFESPPKALIKSGAIGFDLEQLLLILDGWSRVSNRSSKEQDT